MAQLHHHVQGHIKKHKKKYVRFFIFFLFILIFGILEDVTAITMSGNSFSFFILSISIITAFLFTAVAEITEVLFQKEKKNIKKAFKEMEEEEKKILKRK